MKSRTKVFRIGVFVALFATLGVAVHARSAKKTSKGSSAGTYHLSEMRGPIRPVDLSPLGKDVSSEIVAGPTNGLDSAFLIYTRMPAGTRGPSMYTLPVEHTYLVLEGQLNVALGTDKFVVGPDTLVLVHSGVPHEAWNAGTAPVSVLEVVTPAPSRDLMSMMKPAEPRKIENAAQYVRAAKPIPGNTTRGVNSQPLAARATDSLFVQERIDNVNQGFAVGPGLHVHPFDQIYFVLKGTMTLQYGLATYQVKPNNFVIIQTGVVHQNKNDAPERESHVTLLLPEPEKEPFDIRVEFKPTPPPPPPAQ